MSAEAELVDRVLLLPAGDRAALAGQILLSLEPTVIDADAEAAWAVEIEGRLAKLDRGEVTTIDWRESNDRAREALKRPEAT